MIFSAKDIDYMIFHLDEDQLKHELHQADVNIGVSKIEGNDEDLEFWTDYEGALRLAIEVVNSNKPVKNSENYKGWIDIESVKQANDIVEVVERYVKLRKAGKCLSGRCPFHEDKNPSFMVYPDRQSWHCFSCNTGGDCISFIRAVEKCDFKQAVVILGGG